MGKLRFNSLLMKRLLIPSGVALLTLPFAGLWQITSAAGGNTGNPPGSRTTPTSQLETSVQSDNAPPSTATTNAVSQTSTDIQSSVQANTTANPVSTKVTVNGQAIAVPENGSISTSISGANGNNSQVDIQINNSSKGSSSQSGTSSSSLNVYSSSHSSTSVDNTQYTHTTGDTN